MNKLFFAGAVAAGLALQSLSFAHGGTYRGPGDTTPPSGGGGGGGGNPGTPLPGNPGQPGAGGRPTPGAGTPGSPTGSPGGPNGPKTPLGGDSIDLSSWQQWWGFNKDGFLTLKSHIRRQSTVTGTDDYYLGRGTRDSERDMQIVSEQTIRGSIVPKLLDALANESSNDIKSSCMIALAKIGEVVSEDGHSPIAAAIKAYLGNSNQELAETAAVSLGILASRDNILLLTALLDNDAARLRPLGLQGNVDVRTRAFAAYGLGLIGYKASNEDRIAINASLRRILDGEGKTMAQRDIQTACLTAIGLSPLEIDAQAHGDVAPKSATAEKLTSRQDQLRYLLAYFGDDANNPLLRAHAPTAMARLLSTGDVPASFELKDTVATRLMASLTKASKDHSSMQQSCALALGVIGDCDEDPTDKAIRASLMSVKDELNDMQARNFSLIALAQVSGRPGHGAGDAIYGVNCRNKQENSRSFLLGELAKKRYMVYEWSAIAIAVMERSLEDNGQASSTDSKLALSSALDDARSPAAIGAFSIACGLARDKAAKNTLIANLESVRDAEARGYTAVGLGLMDEQSALRPIQEIVKKSKYNADLLKSAAIGLGLLGDKELVPELVTMLENATALATQAAVSSALGSIGDSRSVDPLIRVMQDQKITSLARAFSAVALGIIADKEDLPWNAKIAVNSNYRANTPSLTDQKGGILDIL
ncbi:MAG TPA: HEAT repeat domain-containing protein [Planctomycetota bacterium]|nr:HEAT repeat domain-containing protein [Planctomycetota bacterium]